MKPTVHTHRMDVNMTSRYCNQYATATERRKFNNLPSILHNNMERNERTRYVYYRAGRSTDAKHALYVLKYHQSPAECTDTYKCACLYYSLCSHSDLLGTNNGGHGYGTQTAQFSVSRKKKAVYCSVNIRDDFEKVMCAIFTLIITINT